MLLCNRNCWKYYVISFLYFSEKFETPPYLQVLARVTLGGYQGGDEASYVYSFWVVFGWNTTYTTTPLDHAHRGVAYGVTVFKIWLLSAFGSLFGRGCFLRNAWRSKGCMVESLKLTCYWLGVLAFLTLARGLEFSKLEVASSFLSKKPCKRWYYYTLNWLY